jgi:hypothetical protein
MTIRTTKQNWTPGQTVKVGFMALTVVAVVATPGNWLPDQYVLTNGRSVYRFIPHNGLTKCASVAEAMIAA